MKFPAFEPVSQHDRAEASLSKGLWALCRRGEYAIIFTLHRQKLYEHNRPLLFWGPC